MLRPRISTLGQRLCDGSGGANGASHGDHNHVFRGAQMNKADLIEQVAEEAGISKVKAKHAIDTVIDRIRDAVKRDESVTLVGFGTFDLGGRRRRVGRNPRTGEEIIIEAARVPKFRAGKAFKNDVK